MDFYINDDRIHYRILNIDISYEHEPDDELTFDPSALKYGSREISGTFRLEWPDAWLVFAKLRGEALMADTRSYGRAGGLWGVN